jgi:hypothetical protein
VSYERFQTVDGVVLPIKFKAKRADAQVKVIVQRWQ